MSHSKISSKEKHDTMTRLRREGRWEKAWLRREELRNAGDLTADGAWRQMEREFPPLELESPVGLPDEGAEEDVDFDAC